MECFLNQALSLLGCDGLRAAASRSLLVLHQMQEVLDMLSTTWLLEHLGKNPTCCINYLTLFLFH